MPIGSLIKKVIGPVLGLAGTAVGGPVGGIIGSGLGSAFSGSSSPADAITGVAGGLTNYLGAKQAATQQLGTSIEGAKAGAAIDRQSARDQMSDRFDFFESKGATISEQLGMGHGGTAQGAAPTLGNSLGQVEMQQRQQAYEARERDKDRAVQMRAQDLGVQSSQIAAQGGVDSSSIAAMAAMYGADTNAATAAAQLDWTKQSTLLNMGLDNVLSSATAIRYGVDVTKPETIMNMPPAKFTKFINDVMSQQSLTRQNVTGIQALVQGYALNAKEALEGGPNLSMGPSSEISTAQPMFTQGVPAGINPVPNSLGGGLINRQFD